MAETPLRIGILGAARIAPMALINPARFVPEATVSAVAARDAERARVFATKYGIPTVHGSYDAMLADPEVDAIYNPLPNGLHMNWTIRALDAGKHVLCEKPLASNADEAEQMAAAAVRSKRILMEAFHWRYHPLATRMKEILDSGRIGNIRHIEAHMCIPLPLPNDIRYRFDLAGGATMDTGCYAINIVRHLAGAEPTVVSARSRLMSADIDRWMEAQFQFADGRTGRITCSLLSASVIRMSAMARGDRGEMKVLNPVAPHFGHWLRVVAPERSSFERVQGEATYTHQLRAFVAAVKRNAPYPSTPADGVANMRVIDAIYEKAGMRRRGSSDLIVPKT